MTEPHASPLLDVVTATGGVMGDYHGRPLARHFGDPAAEYAAATGSAAVFDRGHRARVTVSGRAPLQMLSGVLTGRMPGPPAEADGVWTGEGTYHAVLTPKGRMVTDLWALLLGDEADPGLLLDVPAAGGAGLLEHFGRVIPPRFARVEDRSSALAAITVVGPEAPGIVSRLALGLRAEPGALSDADEGVWWRAGTPADGLVVMRTAEVWPVALNVYGAPEPVGALWTALLDEGVAAAGLGVWSTLRVEAGRPAYGTDMDSGTIPVEAGIHERAIDHTKGCYTGQEVIVRIRDRGHVNRHLRLLELGQGPTPPAGTELYDPSSDPPGKAVGHVTSAVDSPRHGGAIALAYVRRGVGAVTVGSAAGPRVPVPER